MRISTVFDTAAVMPHQENLLAGQKSLAPLLLLAEASQPCQACRGCLWTCATRPRTTSCPRCRCCAWPRAPRSPGLLWATGSARPSTWPLAARASPSCSRCNGLWPCDACVYTRSCTWHMLIMHQLGPCLFPRQRPAQRAMQGSIVTCKRLRSIRPQYMRASQCALLRILPRLAVQAVRLAVQAGMPKKIPLMHWLWAVRS